MRESVINVSEDVLKANELILAGTPLICFDLETTGTSALTDRTLSISAIKTSFVNGLPEEVGRLDLLINPGFHIPEEASNVNHILDEDVVGKPSEEELLPVIKTFFGERPFICGYNSKRFDLAFVKALYARGGEEFNPLIHIDVMEMAKEMLDLKSYKLQNVAHELGVDRGITFHTSIDDCLATFRSFMILLKDYTNPTAKAARLPKARVIGAKFWAGYSHTTERIYVMTEPYSKSYYDIYRKEWKSDNEFDMKALREDALSYCNVETEAQMVKALKTIA